MACLSCTGLYNFTKINLSVIKFKAKKRLRWKTSRAFSESNTTQQRPYEPCAPCLPKKWDSTTHFRPCGEILEHFRVISLKCCICSSWGENFLQLTFPCEVNWPWHRFLGRLWSFRLLIYSEAIWTCFWAASSRWLCCSRRTKLDDLQRPLPTSAPLRFCEGLHCISYQDGPTPYPSKTDTPVYTWDSFCLPTGLIAAILSSGNPLFWDSL